MQTVARKAHDPITKKEYEIELPTHNVIRKAILELDYPEGGIRIIDATLALSKRFQLSEKHNNAKRWRGKRYLDVFRYDIVAPAFKYLLKKGKLKQPGGSKTPYFLAANTPNPEELIEKNYEKIQEKLATELLQQIKNNTPAFFEELVIDLLVAMGYGGSREDAAKAVGGSGDGGIDGIINEDRLGLDIIYVQAKRWEGNVSRPEIQKFAGALQGERARKGIFITTSNFTKDAEGYVKTIDTKINLINGKQLAEYMIEHNVGVSVEKTYEIKRVDSDYFAQDTENA